MKAVTERWSGVSEEPLETIEESECENHPYGERIIQARFRRVFNELADALAAVAVLRKVLDEATKDVLAGGRPNLVDIAETLAMPLPEFAKKMEAVLQAASKMPRRTPTSGGAGTAHWFEIEAGVVWELDKALSAIYKR
jgi:hypothetical protein